MASRKRYINGIDIQGERDEQHHSGGTKSSKLQAAYISGILVGRDAYLQDRGEPSFYSLKECRVCTGDLSFSSGPCTYLLLGRKASLQAVLLGSTRQVQNNS